LEDGHDVWYCQGCGIEIPDGKTLATPKQSLSAETSTPRNTKVRS